MADEENELPKEPLSVYEFITIMVDQMAGFAWQKLGLQPDVMTGKIRPTMPSTMRIIPIIIDSFILHILCSCSFVYTVQAWACPARPRRLSFQ